MAIIQTMPASKKTAAVDSRLVYAGSTVPYVLNPDVLYPEWALDGYRARLSADVARERANRRVNAWLAGRGSEAVVRAAEDKNGVSL